MGRNLIKISDSISQTYSSLALNMAINHLLSQEADV